jgi:RNase P subunit RPR2
MKIKGTIRLPGTNLDVQIADEDELVEQQAIILSVRVADMPDSIVPAEKVACAACEEDVWLSKKASVPMYKRGLVVMCMQCVMKMEESQDNRA